MIGFLKKYKHFAFGFGITFVMAISLESLGILVNVSMNEEGLFGFLLHFLPISFAIRNYLRKQGKLYHVVVAFTVFFLLFATVGHYTKDMRDNPVFTVCIIGFWLVIFYFILPAFFKKYRFLVLGIYGFACLYFIYVRIFSETFESYLEHGKQVAFYLFFIPIPFFSLLIIYDQWKWVKSLQTEKTAMELAMLKSQINPHFLFNTLNNLYSLTVQQSQEAPDVVLKLSDMMRYTIYEGKKEMLPLSSEIRYLEDYIGLQKIRYRKKVDIQFSHEVGNDCQIAPLLLILLVENAFKHGVEKLRKDAFVHIRLTEENGLVRFTVENNFDPEEESSKGGIGLENLNARLLLTYPNKHHMEIEKSEVTYCVQLNIETT